MSEEWRGTSGVFVQDDRRNNDRDRDLRQNRRHGRNHGDRAASLTNLAVEALRAIAGLVLMIFPGWRAAVMRSRGFEIGTVKRRHGVRHAGEGERERNDKSKQVTRHDASKMRRHRKSVNA